MHITYADQSNGNIKDRYIVLIADFDDEDDHAYGVAITTKFTYPLNPDEVKLPFNRTGSCKTGLSYESVAVCRWIVEIDPSDIGRRCGFVSGHLLDEIIDQVQKYLDSN